MNDMLISIKMYGRKYFNGYSKVNLNSGACLSKKRNSMSFSLTFNTI